MDMLLAVFVIALISLIFGIARTWVNYRVLKESREYWRWKMGARGIGRHRRKKR